jgi:hypothetical protein
MTRFWLWIALAAAGQGAALRLIDAGPRIHFQHYFAAGLPLVAVFVIVIQMVLVVVAISARLPSVLGLLRSRLGSWRLILLAVFIVSTSAALSREPASWVVEIAFATCIEVINLFTVFLALAALPQAVWAFWRSRLIGWLGEEDDHPAAARAADRWPLVAAALVVLVAAGLSYFVYQNHPHLQDEVGYLLHARYLAAGKVTLPIPPVPDAFDFYLMGTGSKGWFSIVPPGWPAVLAIGVWLGVPWLVNPLLAGLNVWIAWLFLREVCPAPTARLVLLLLCASPWFIFMSMNFLTHTILTTVVWLAALGIVRARSSGKSGWAWVAGLAIGFASLVRPLDALIAAILFGQWAMGLGGKRLRFASLAALATGTVLMGALAGPYNAYLSGSPTQAPLQVYMDQKFGKGSNDLGFGPNRGSGWPIDAWPGHSPLEAVLNTALSASSVNTELHGWSIGSLWAVAIAVLAGRGNRTDRIWLGAVAVIVFVYGFYHFSGGPDFGARYWYQALLPLLILSARGLETLSQWVGDERPIAAAILLSVLALGIYLPWRAADKYWHYLFMRPDVREEAARHNFGRSLVLIRGQEFPDYVSAAIYNPLDLRPESSEAAPIYAWDRDAATHAKLLALYRDRPVWVLEGPTLTGGAYRIVQKPVEESHR